MDDCFLDHDTGEHPECAARLRSVAQHLNETDLIARFDRGKINMQWSINCIIWMRGQ